MGFCFDLGVCWFHVALIFFFGWCRVVAGHDVCMLRMCETNTATCSGQCGQFSMVSNSQ